LLVSINSCSTVHYITQTPNGFAAVMMLKIIPKNAQRGFTKTRKTRKIIAR